MIQAWGLAYVEGPNMVWVCTLVRSTRDLWQVGFYLMFEKTIILGDTTSLDVNP